MKNKTKGDPVELTTLLFVALFALAMVFSTRPVWEYRMDEYPLRLYRFYGRVQPNPYPFPTQEDLRESPLLWLRFEDLDWRDGEMERRPITREGP